jgi:SAM-dependent methyltransferase
MSCCESIDRQFDRAEVEGMLRRFRRRGPDRSTRLLIEALRSDGPIGETLLDIGGGIGAIHHELLDAGMHSAVEVDISSASIAAAEEEARRRGHDGRVQFVRGDFVDIAAGIDAADVVTLDRVICCYPNMEQLVAASSAKAKRLYGAVYPRESPWMRVGVVAINGWLRLTRSDFRVYLHAPAAIVRALTQHGLHLRTRRRTIAWEVAVFARTSERAA